MASNNLKKQVKTWNQLGPANVPMIKSTSSGKDKERKTPGWNFLYQMEPIDTKIIHFDGRIGVKSNFLSQL
jgi:hypothetical protein